MKYFLKPDGYITGKKAINSKIEAEFKKLGYKECDLDGKLITAKKEIKKKTTKKKK
tara:strand:+ start:15578 stop:15745 length:168 start_codon:yes stop_codon:yes gene_type:complete